MRHNTPIVQPISNISLEAELVPDTAKTSCDNLLMVSPTHWAVAESRLEILRPLLIPDVQPYNVAAVAQVHHVSCATIYRWLAAYRSQSSITALLPAKTGRKSTRSYLEPGVEEIIQEALISYLSFQRKPIAFVNREVKRLCRDKGINAPSRATVYRRIHALDEALKVRRREGTDSAHQRFDLLSGNFPGADYPLAVVQVDHSLVDILLVDETYREPVGRPYLTLAIDVYSRMIVGYHLAFEPPGAGGTGLCLINTIMAKDDFLTRVGVVAEWPCKGLMRTLHFDNAREFHGRMLTRACAKYGIDIVHRPPGEPSTGGHIERAIQTAMQEAHLLPGTTFSNIAERGKYDSARHSALTLPEFERWLTEFLINIYHRRIHEGIQEAPFDRYQRDCVGPGVPPPRIVADIQQLRLDFMPAEQRTIQRYGVRIGYLHYSADVLRPYVNRLEPGSTRRKCKYWFKRDPRDISCLYFLDPKTQVYHPIPFRDRSQRSISAYEYQAVRRRLRSAAESKIDETKIFEAYQRMQKQESDSVHATRKRRRTKLQNRLNSSTVRSSIELELPAAHTPLQKTDISDGLDNEPILPFDGLGYGTSSA